MRKPVSCVLLALIHVFFPRYFNWKAELNRISLINRQLMQVHSFFVVFVGLPCLTSAHDLLGTRLGNRLAFGLFIFWSVRLLVQFFG